MLNSEQRKDLDRLRTLPTRFPIEDGLSEQQEYILRSFWAIDDDTREYIKRFNEDFPPIH